MTDTSFLILILTGFATFSFSLWINTVTARQKLRREAESLNNKELERLAVLVGMAQKVFLQTWITLFIVLILIIFCHSARLI